MQRRHAQSFFSYTKRTQKAAFAYSRKNIHLVAYFALRAKNKLHKENKPFLVA